MAPFLQLMDTFFLLKPIIIIPLVLSVSLTGVDIKLTHFWSVKLKDKFKEDRKGTFTKGFLSHKKILKEMVLYTSAMSGCDSWSCFSHFENETNGRKNRAKGIQRSEEHSGNTMPGVSCLWN